MDRADKQMDRLKVESYIPPETLFAGGGSLKNNIELQAAYLYTSTYNKFPLMTYDASRPIKHLKLHPVKNKILKYKKIS